jgi:hypothetical protein
MKLIDFFLPARVFENLAEGEFSRPRKIAVRGFQDSALDPIL